MTVFEQVRLMGEIAKTTKEPQEIRLSEKSALDLRAAVSGWVAAAPYGAGLVFTLKDGVYHYQGIPLVIDEAIPWGEVVMYTKGASL